MSDRTLDLNELFGDEAPSRFRPPPTDRERRIASTLANRNPQRGERIIPTRWRTICSLELRGHPKTEIAQVMGMHVNSIIKITHSPTYLKLRDEVLDELDKDFISMKPLAFKALQNALTSSNENTALSAAETFFKTSGFGSHGKGTGEAGPVTAEDVAARLLVQVNVQVNSSQGDD